MLVAIVHNAVPPGASPSDRDVLFQVEAVAALLDALGHAREKLPATLDLESLRSGLLQLRPAVVFNLVESLGGCDWLQHAATSLFDTMGLAYTGSPTAAVLLSNHKLLAKERLCRAGLPTPSWLVPVNRPLGRPPEGWEGSAFAPGAPYILKAATEHASLGLEEDAVVRADDESELRDRLRQFAGRLGKPCFAERYIEGREFNLSVLAGPDGPQVLPPAEIDFSAFPAGKARIVGYRAKWEDASFEFINTPRRFDFPEADRPLLDCLQVLARQCWDLFGLGGYVRVDFRVDTEGRAWILEINTNPCLSPDAGFAAALQRASIGFPEAVARILDNALSNLDNTAQVGYDSCKRLSG